MKKLLPLLLAVLMVLGMAAPALAATVYEERGGIVGIDEDILDGASYLTPGATYKFLLMNGNDPVDGEFMDLFKTTMKVTEGREYLASATMEKEGSRYYLIIKTKPDNGKYLGEVHQVIITLTSTERNVKNADRDKNSSGDIIIPRFIEELSFEIGFSDATYLSDGDYEVDIDSPIVTAGDASRVKLIFGSIAEYDARFGTTERKFNLAYNTSENGTVVKNNPNANIKFVTFSGNPWFQINSNLRIYMKDAQYLYEIKDNKLVELSATKGDGYMEYRTDSLSSYVVSDRRLTGDAGSSSTSGSAPTTSGATLSTEDAKNAVQSAAALARASGYSTASVRFTGVDSVSYDVLSKMRTQAGMPVAFMVDTMTSGGAAVDVRVQVNPYYSVKGLNFAASTTSAQANSTKEFFQKWFSNNVRVVSLNQKTAFGQTASIAAKVDLSNMNTQNLYFYAYNSENNSYDRITAPAYYVDSAGYLHFNTAKGGDIIISSGPLSYK